MTSSAPIPPMLAKSGPDVFESWATASSMTSLPPKLPKTPMPPSCRFRRAANVGQVRAGRFRELGHRIFHDFLATQAAENTDDVELPIPPGRKCWPSQGVDIFES